jgi:thiol:disulfide interchange protein
MLSSMLRNTVRGILALILTAIATWLANRIVEQLFGPEEAEAARR